MGMTGGIGPEWAATHPGLLPRGWPTSIRQHGFTPY